MLFFFFITIFSSVCGSLSDSNINTFRDPNVANQVNNQGSDNMSILNNETHKTGQATKIQKEIIRREIQHHHGVEQFKNNNNKKHLHHQCNTRTGQNSTDNVREFHAFHQITHKKDEALFLTPLIENGEAKRARMLAKVPTMKRVESFAGYLTINSTTDANLFFWLFKNQEARLEERPLIVWLHGGFGQTHMLGQFRDVGPFYISHDRKLKRRKYSLNRKCNLVFVDSPVGTGFSFTKFESGYPASLEAVAEDLYTFLIQLHMLFPSFKQNDLILVGNSFGTIIAQLLAHKIYKENKISNFKLNLKRLVLYSKLRKVGVLERNSAYFYDLKLIDNNQRLELARLEENLLLAELSGNTTESVIFQLEIRDRVKNFTGLRDTSDVVHDNIVVDQKNLTVWFLNQPKTKRVLHVGEYNLTAYSVEANLHLQRGGGFLVSTKPILEAFLTTESLPILSMNGQFDPLGVISGGRYDSYKWPRAEEFFKAKRCQLKFEGEVAAYYKSAGTLTEVVMRNAGHLLAAAQPRWSFEILHRFIADDKYFQCT